MGGQLVERIGVAGAKAISVGTAGSIGYGVVRHFTGEDDQQQQQQQLPQPKAPAPLPKP